MDVNRHLEAVLPVLTFPIAPFILPTRHAFGVSPTMNKCYYHRQYQAVGFYDSSVRFYVMYVMNLVVVVLVVVVVVVVVIIITNYMSNALIQCVLLCGLRRENIIFMGHIIFVGTKNLKAGSPLCTDENIELGCT